MPIGKLQKNKPQTIIGIDPGIADTGFGIIKKNESDLKLIAYGSIKTSKHKELGVRLLELEKNLQILIKKYQPDKAVVEKLFFCNNQKTAIIVGQARGVIMLTLEKNKIPTIELTPLQVKQGIVGYGKAEKKQIQQLVKMILKLKKIPQPDDASDALAMAICGSNFLKNISK